MLADLTTKQNAYKMVLQQVARAYESELKRSKAESIIPELKTAGKMIDLDFDSLFTDYRADFLMEELEQEISKLEKSVGMNDGEEILDVGC